MRSILVLFWLLVPALSSLAYADPFEYAFKELSPGIWVGIRENSPRFPVMGTTTFVVGDEGVIVFDGGGVALMSERALAKIRSVTDKPISHIVISHWHGDHNLGIHRLLDEFPHAQIIGHSFTRAAMLGAPMDYVRGYPDIVPELEKRFQNQLDSGVSSGGEPLSDSTRGNLQTILDDAELIHSEYNRVRVTPPTVTFSDQLVIHSGRRVIELRHLGHGNTAGDIVMWLPGERIVATGDLVVFPTPYGFNVPPRAWAKTLRKLRALNFNTLIPGHGDVQTDTRYLDLLVETAESIADQRDTLLAEGMSLEETEAALDFSPFAERFTGGDEFLVNRFEVWFTRPFRKAALKAITGEPMVRLEREQAAEALVGGTTAVVAGPSNGPEPSPREAQVDALFAEFDRPDSPGCGVGVYQAGEVLFAKGYGMANLEHRVPITPQTVFDIASNSKQFTALAIFLLEQRALLTLDDEVRRHLPELPDFGSPITLRHLLHNTSGLREIGDLRELQGFGIDYPVSQRDFLELMLRQRSLNFTPGERYLYSNSNWILLATILERLDGRPFRKFMEDEVFRPLAMLRTVVRDDPTQILPDRASTYTPVEGAGLRINHSWGLATGLAGMSFIHSTIEDLARWDANFYTGRVGGKEISQRMYSRGQVNSGEFVFYAAGLMVGQHGGLRTISHGGYGGGSSQLTRFPDQRLSVAVLCNRYYTHTDANGLALGVADLYLDDVMEPSADPLSSEDEAAVALSEADLARYAGRYWIEEDRRLAEFVVRNGNLVELDSSEEYPLVALGEGRFQDPYESIVFDPGGMKGDGEHRDTGMRYRLVRKAPWEPSTLELTEYAGRYFSEELDVSWTLVVTGDALVLRREAAADQTLVPVFPGAFVLQNWLLEPRRGPNGSITHLLVSTDRVIDLEFARVPARGPQ